MCTLVDVDTVLLKGSRLTVQESKVLHHIQDKHSLGNSTERFLILLCQEPARG